MQYDSNLPHFQLYSSTDIPATVADIEPASVLHEWSLPRHAVGNTNDDKIIELFCSPVFIVHGETKTLINEPSMRLLHAHWQGTPPSIAQNPGALIRAYFINAADVTSDQEALLFFYFGDIESHILPISDPRRWPALVDLFLADPTIERLCAEHIFHKPALELTAGQMSKFFNNIVSEDSIRRHLRKHGRIAKAFRTSAANDDEYDPTAGGAVERSDKATQPTETAGDNESSAEAASLGSTAEAGEAIEAPAAAPSEQTPEKASPDADPHHGSHTAADGQSTDRRDAGTHQDGRSEEMTAPPKQAKRNHRRPAHRKGLFNPFKRGSRRGCDE